MPRNARLIAFWALVGLLALFIVFNFRYVPINLLLLRVEVPAALLIFLSAGLGASAVLLLQFLRDHRKSRAAAPPPPPPPPGAP